MLRRVLRTCIPLQHLNRNRNWCGWWWLCLSRPRRVLRMLMMMAQRWIVRHGHAQCVLRRVLVLVLVLRVLPVLVLVLVLVRRLLLADACSLLRPGGGALRGVLGMVTRTRSPCSPLIRVCLGWRRRCAHT